MSTWFSSISLHPWCPDIAHSRQYVIVEKVTSPKESVLRELCGFSFLILKPSMFLTAPWEKYSRVMLLWHSCPCGVWPHSPSPGSLPYSAKFILSQSGSHAPAPASPLLVGFGILLLLFRSWLEAKWISWWVLIKGLLKKVETEFREHNQYTTEQHLECWRAVH